MPIIIVLFLLILGTIPAHAQTRVQEMPPAPPAGPQTIIEGFEGTPAGQTPDVATNEENEAAIARVTDETAAEGKHSLKFTDALEQKAADNPHIYWSPKFSSGVAQASFALRVETGAVLSHEWRDATQPYHVGPSIQVRADGVLVAGKRELLEVPPHDWVRLNIFCPLGQDAKGQYDLQVTLPDGTTHTYRELTCSPNFRELQWFGFVSDAEETAVFYLDDVKVEQLAIQRGR